MGPRGALRVSLALACLLQVQGAVRETSSSSSSSSPPPPVRPEGRPVVQDLVLSPHRSIVSSVPAGKHTPAQMSEAYPVVSETSSDRNETNPNKNLKVKLPSLPCNDYRDCWQYTDPLLECRAGQCTCAPPFCWIYRYEATSIWAAKYVFQCGTCGVLGSSCNTSLACDFPGECWSDDYCHCPHGENDNNICMTSNSNWTFKLALYGIGFILLFALCLSAWNCYKDPPWRRPEPWCCGFCHGTRGTEQRRSSSDKTPAFTIQCHYANQVFTGSTPSDQNPGVSPDEDVGGASATSRNPRRRSRAESGGSSVGEDNSSYSSVITTITDVSTSSTLPAADDPAAAAASGSATGKPLGANKSLRYQVFSLNVDAPPETTNFQTPSETGDSDDGSVAGSSGSCTHERCQLCLPKGPMTRPPSGGVTASPASAKRVQLPHLKSLDPTKRNISIESTNL